MGHVMVVEVYCDRNVVFLFGKKKFRSLFWKVRAEVRRQLLNNIISNSSSNHKKHHNFSFHYDPLSYALNFDDGYCGFLCL